MKEDFTGSVIPYRRTTCTYHSMHYTGRFLISRGEKAGQLTKWKGIDKKDLQKWDSHWEEAEAAALSRKDGVGIHIDVGWIKVKVISVKRRLSGVNLILSRGVATGGYIGIYTHPKSVHLKFLWGIFSSSCEAETS